MDTVQAVRRDGKLRTAYSLLFYRIYVALGILALDMEHSREVLLIRVELLNKNINPCPTTLVWGAFANNSDILMQWEVNLEPDLPEGGRDMLSVSIGDFVGLRIECSEHGRAKETHGDQDFARTTMTTKGSKLGSYVIESARG